MKIPARQPVIRSETESEMASRPPETPTEERIAELEAELREMKYRHSIRSSLFAWLVVLMLSAIFVALILRIPIARIQSDNMTPLLQEGDIVFLMEQDDYQRGDVVSFYFNTRMLVRRCVAFAGETINIDQDGVVTVDGHVLDEPYAAVLAQGMCNVEMPFKVPDGSIFVLGDNRETSLDSRNTALGCVMADQIIGKV